MKRGDPVAAADVAAWRDAARTWACHEYAYAVPNEAALDALRDLGPVVEAGAGTGYWAWALRKRGGDVRAFDSAPPDAAANAYARPRRSLPSRTARLRGLSASSPRRRRDPSLRHIHVVAAAPPRPVSATRSPDVVEQVVAARDDARRVQREHAPGDPAPLGPA